AGGGVEPIMFAGFIPVVGYQASVLPAFIAGILGAKLEKRIRDKVPEALDLIVTPFMTLLIMITLALFVIGLSSMQWKASSWMPHCLYSHGRSASAVYSLADWSRSSESPLCNIFSTGLKYSG